MLKLSTFLLIVAAVGLVILVVAALDPSTFAGTIEWFNRTLGTSLSHDSSRYVGFGVAAILFAVVVLHAVTVRLTRERAGHKSREEQLLLGIAGLKQGVAGNRSSLDALSSVDPHDVLSDIEAAIDRQREAVEGAEGLYARSFTEAKDRIARVRDKLRRLSERIAALHQSREERTNQIRELGSETDELDEQLSAARGDEDGWHDERFQELDDWLKKTLALTETLEGLPDRIDAARRLTTELLARTKKLEESESIADALKKLDKETDELHEAIGDLEPDEDEDSFEDQLKEQEGFLHDFTTGVEELEAVKPRIVVARD